MNSPDPNESPPLPPHIVAALAHNHYDRRWLDLGVLPECLLLKQASVPWNRSDDPHTEHRRWEAFREYLRSNPTLSDAQFQALLTLAEIDPESELQRAILIELLQLPGLSEAQFERLCNLPIMAQSTKQIGRARARRRLARGEWSAELIESILCAPDSAVQADLFDHPRLDHATLLALADRGHSQGIRNRAAHLLKSRRFSS